MFLVVELQSLSTLSRPRTPPKAAPEAVSVLPICSSDSGGLCMLLTSLAGAAGQTAAAGGWEEEGACSLKHGVANDIHANQSCQGPIEPPMPPPPPAPKAASELSLSRVAEVMDCCRRPAFLLRPRRPGDVLEHLHRPPGWRQGAYFWSDEDQNWQQSESQHQVFLNKIQTNCPCLQAWLREKSGQVAWPGCSWRPPNGHGCRPQHVGGRGQDGGPGRPGKPGMDPVCEKSRSFCKAPWLQDGGSG